MNAAVISSSVARLDDQLCTRCWLCLPSCDAGALMRVPGEQDLLLDFWACRGCGDCVRACPAGALVLGGRTRA